MGRSFRMHQMLNIWFEKSRFHEVGRRSPSNAAAVYNWFEKSMSREKVGWQSLSNASVEQLVRKVYIPKGGLAVPFECIS